MRGSVEGDIIWVPDATELYVRGAVTSPAGADGEVRLTERPPSAHQAPIFGADSAAARTQITVMVNGEQKKTKEFYPFDARDEARSWAAHAGCAA